MKRTGRLTIEKHILDQSKRAIAHSEDGAFHMAARILRDLADDMDRHVEKVDRMMEEFAAKTRESEVRS